jgi:hypothetical protein
MVGGAVLAVLAAACAGRADGPSAQPPPPPPERLIRPGATPLTTVAADLDGDGADEMVISSVSNEVDDLGLARPFLEAFDVRDGRWTRVFDATGPAPPGPGAPPSMLSAEGFVSQAVATLETVDFAADGRPEVAVGIANFGASAGPVELWVVSMAGDGALATLLYRTSARGGEISVEGDRLRFEYGVYRSRDPGCCPSRFAVETIGWNPAADRVEVLERRETRAR